MENEAAEQQQVEDQKIYFDPDASQMAEIVQSDPFGI